VGQPKRDVQLYCPGQVCARSHSVYHGERIAWYVWSTHEDSIDIQPVAPSDLADLTQLYSAWYLLDDNVSYHAKTGILNFSYKTRGTFIRQFKEDWEKVVRMLKIIRQLQAPTTSNPYIQLQVCHLHHVKLAYFGRYTVNIRWAAASTPEKRSSSGVVILPPPRFRQGLYEIELSVVNSGQGLLVNPHHRMKYFLQDMFNREADLHSLMNVG